MKVLQPNDVNTQLWYYKRSAPVAEECRDAAMQGPDGRVFPKVVEMNFSGRMRPGEQPQSFKEMR